MSEDKKNIEVNKARIKEIHEEAQRRRQQIEEKLHPHEEPPKAEITITAEPIPEVAPEIDQETEIVFEPENKIEEESKIEIEETVIPDKLIEVIEEAADISQSIQSSDSAETPHTPDTIELIQLSESKHKTLEPSTILACMITISASSLTLSTISFEGLVHLAV